MISSDRLFEWREALAELDRLTSSIRGEDDKKRAAFLIDKLEREIHESYLETNAAEVRCMCAASTPDAPTRVDAVPFDPMEIWVG